MLSQIEATCFGGPEDGTTTRIEYGKPTVFVRATTYGVEHHIYALECVDGSLRLRYIETYREVWR